jgi:hypothetical protein
MSEQQQSSFSGWARVEIMGHSTHTGFVTTEVFGAASLFRVDQPEIPEYEETLEFTQTIAGERAPAGSIVKRPKIPGVSVLLGIASIYRIVPCTEEACIKAIKAILARPPMMLVRLPDKMQLPAASIPDDDEDDEDEEDPPIVAMTPTQMYDSYREHFEHLNLLPWETLHPKEQSCWTEFLYALRAA